MRRHLYRSFSLCVLGAALGLTNTRALDATSYSIVTVADDFTVTGNCTLREAVQAAVANVAIDACPAGSADGLDSIALSAGTYTLALGPLSISAGASLRVHGPAAEPPTAVISGGMASRIFDLGSAGGTTLTLEDLELRDGQALGGAMPMGGAVRVYHASLTARRVRFDGNTAVFGGAIGFLGLGAQHSLTIEDCRFEHNLAQQQSHSIGSRGGALSAETTSGATARIVDSEFVENRSESGLDFGSALGGAVALFGANPPSTVEIDRSRFARNQVAASGAGGMASQAGLAGHFTNGASVQWRDLELTDNAVLQSDIAARIADVGLELQGESQASIRRIRLCGGTSTVHEIRFGIDLRGSARLDLQSALLCEGGDGTALGVSTWETASALIHHLTVSGHAGTGLHLHQQADSQLELFNSIVFGNGTDVATVGAPFVSPTNLIGVDPLFTDASSGDYTLTELSPAVDSGDSGAAGLAPYDLAHAARVVGAATDLGAFERGGIFSDGFEGPSTGAWRW